MGKIIFSDIHGCYKTFLALVNKVKEDFPNDEIVIAGDIIDRGPKSKQMVEYCIENNIKVCQGNHEDMCIIDVLDHPSPWKGGWVGSQGVECIKSYFSDGKLDNDLMKKHAEWMKTLPLYLEFEDIKNEEGRHLVVSHSSIFEVWKNRTTQDDNFKQHVLWNRDYISSDAKHMNIFNVFGHTPFPDGPRITDCYANIDTGACFKERHYGVLTALHFPSMKIYQIKNLD